MAPPTWIVSLVKEATQVKWLQVGLISFLEQIPLDFRHSLRA